MTVTSPEETAEQEPIRVLHVDDEPDFADLAGTFLEREDERLVIETATSAADGQTLLADGRFDCVVSDYDMPGQNGIELLRAVRETHPDTPFILFTGKGSEEIASEAISAGVTDYLQKETGTDQYTILANRITNAVSQSRAQRAVSRTREYFGTVLGHASDFVMVVDDTGQVDYISAAVERILGYSPTALQGTDAFELIHPDDLSIATEAFAAVLEEPDEEHAVEYRARHDDGSWRWIEVRGRNRLTDPVIDGIIVSAREATARKTREQELQQVERRYEAVFNDPIVLQALLDPNGAVLDVNETAMAFIDAPVDALTGEPLWETPWFRGDGDLQADIRAWVEQAASGEYVEFEADVPRPAGGTDSLEGIFRPVTDDDGQVVSLLVSAADATDQRRQARQLETLISNLPGMVYRCRNEQEWPMEVVRGECEEVCGYSAAELESDDVAWGRDIITAADQDRIWATVQDAVAAQRPFEISYRIETKTGDTRWVWERGRGVHSPDHDGILLEGFITDITDRHTREHELEQTNTLLSTLLEALPMGVLVEDEHGNVLAVNERLVQLFGISEQPDAILGVDRQQFAADIQDRFIDGEGYLDRLDDAISDTESVTTEALRLHDGRTITLQHEPIALPDGEGHLWVYRDSTDRFAREAELTALHNVGLELAASETVDEVCERTVAAAEHIFDFDRSLVAIEEDGFLVVRATSEAVPEGDTRTISVDSGLAGETYRSGTSFLIRDFDTAGVQKPRGSYRSGLSLPIGRHGNFQAVAEEPDEFDERDLELAELLIDRTESALDRLVYEHELHRQNDRLEEFAHVVSHDLRNPLRVIEGRLELLREDGEEEHIVAMETAAARIDRIIEGVLYLAREGREIGVLTPISFGDAVADAWTLVADDVDSAKLDTGDIEASPLSIEADENQFGQVLENLFRNAIDHGGHDVTITVGFLETGFFVEDDGPGIPEPHQDAVFDAGYSTHVDGTGFGLSIVSHVVDAHGWDIAVTESTHGGARFEITGVEFLDT